MSECPFEQNRPRTEATPPLIESGDSPSNEVCHQIQVTIQADIQAIAGLLDIRDPSQADWLDELESDLGCFAKYGNYPQNLSMTLPAALQTKLKQLAQLNSLDAYTKASLAMKVVLRYRLGPELVSGDD